jgi:hypothetical protein
MSSLLRLFALRRSAAGASSASAYAAFRTARHPSQLSRWNQSENNAGSFMALTMSMACLGSFSARAVVDLRGTASGCIDGGASGPSGSALRRISGLLGALAGRGIPARYKSHIGYDHATIAGTRRVDLDGRAVSTVTLQEGLAAKKRIAEFHQMRNERNERLSQGPVSVLSQMHANGQVSDCGVKKLDAPPLPRPALSLSKRAPEFTSLYGMLATASATVVGIDDPSMRTAVAIASLDVMITKFQQRRSELGQA